MIAKTKESYKLKTYLYNFTAIYLVHALVIYFLKSFKTFFYIQLEDFS